MKTDAKRGYQKHFQNLKPAHEELLISHAQEGWLEAERALKRHEIIQKAKLAGIGVSKFILGMGLAAGLVTFVMVAPNAFAGVAEVSGVTRRQYASLPQSKFDLELSRGSSKKYWRYVKTGSNKYKITLTELGKQVAIRREMRNFKLKPRPAWDGKWHMVMFDIPKKYSATRDTIRRKLYEIGMHSIQESVFVYPYPCKDEVMMWIELFGMEKYIETAEATFSNRLNLELKKIFKL